MARAKFVLPEDTITELAARFLKRPGQAPDGDEERASEFDPTPFSKAIEEALIERFTATPELRKRWHLAKPVALGSWSRGELCPRSDLDLLFLGDESAAGDVTAWAQEAGIKIRSRVPEDRNDWTVGVEPFDVVALYQARALVPEAVDGVAEQQEKLRLRVRTIRRAVLTACRRERHERADRYDSIANFLEPNLKYGAGALRDLGQALQLRALFAERFEGSIHAEQIYNYYRRFFLLVRMRMHLTEAGGDLLSAYEQQTIASWFGFASNRDFMREIQKGLSRVAFYTDVDFARASAGEKELSRLMKREFTSFEAVADGLELDQGPLMQAIARETGFKLYRKALAAGGKSKDSAKDSAIARLQQLLAKAIDPLREEALAIALFRARWLDMIVTDFKMIVGYVQHDQYHRYTVDAHLLQAIREMKRVAQRPTLLGRLANVTKSLNREDWKILGWAALYHDVGKGSGGDHSDRSVEIARRDLTSIGLSNEVIEETLWLIDNHLELSVAAFRGNSADPKVWRVLHAKGIEGKRLQRLAIFTAVDIRATNREAYTPWKERLLAELVQNLEKPEAKSLAKLEKALGRQEKIKECLDRLDPFLVAALPTLELAKDLCKVAQVKSENCSVHMVRMSRKNRLWIRFHALNDRKGLFAHFTRVLQSAGLSVRHASVLSDPTLGVYDWFEVKPPRSIKGLEARLSGLVAKLPIENQLEEKVAVQFDDIDCLSVGDAEWVLSFRGKDQRGALRAAAESLTTCGASIAWAKVHTWGRQLDDVFGVAPVKSLTPQSLLSRLRETFKIEDQLKDKPEGQAALESKN